MPVARNRAHASRDPFSRAALERRAFEFERSHAGYDAGDCVGQHRLPVSLDPGDRKDLAAAHLKACRAQRVRPLACFQIACDQTHSKRSDDALGQGRDLAADHCPGDRIQFDLAFAEARDHFPGA